MKSDIHIFMQNHWSWLGHTGARTTVMHQQVSQPPAVTAKTITARHTFKCRLRHNDSTACGMGCPSFCRTRYRCVTRKWVGCPRSNDQNNHSISPSLSRTFGPSHVAFSIVSGSKRSFISQESVSQPAYRIGLLRKELPWQSSCRHCCQWLNHRWPVVRLNNSIPSGEGGSDFLLLAMTSNSSSVCLSVSLTVCCVLSLCVQWSMMLHEHNIADDVCLYSVICCLAEESLADLQQWNGSMWHFYTIPSHRKAIQNSC